MKTFQIKMNKKLLVWHLLKTMQPWWEITSHLSTSNQPT